MGVPAYYNIVIGKVPANLPPVMYHIEPEAVQLCGKLPGQPSGPVRVRVARHGIDGAKGLQAAEDFGIVHVPAVEDGLAGLYMLHHLRPQDAVGIRYDCDGMGFHCSASS
jgi:hypothetical protein